MNNLLLTLSALETEFNILLSSLRESNFERKEIIEKLAEFIERLQQLKAQMESKNQVYSICFYVTFRPKDVHIINKKVFDAETLGLIRAVDIYAAAEIAHKSFGADYYRLSAYKPRNKNYKIIIKVE